MAGKNFKMLINTEKSGIVYCMECGKYVGLTLTWDVLKRSTNAVVPGFVPGLTLTWDVLKLLYHRPVLFHFWINFNMGCIETG